MLMLSPLAKVPIEEPFCDSTMVIVPIRIRMPCAREGWTFFSR